MNHNNKYNSNNKINDNIYGNWIINPYFINPFFNPYYLNLLNYNNPFINQTNNPFVNPINFPLTINSPLFTNLNSNIIKKRDVEEQKECNEVH